MLETLKKLNPNIPFYSVDDKEFAPFGRVVKDFDASAIIEAAKKIENLSGKSSSCKNIYCVKRYLARLCYTFNGKFSRITTFNIIDYALCKRRNKSDFL